MAEAVSIGLKNETLKKFARNYIAYRQARRGNHGTK